MYTILSSIGVPLLKKREKMKFKINDRIILAMYLDAISSGLTDQQAKMAVLIMSDMLKLEIAEEHNHQLNQQLCHSLNNSGNKQQAPQQTQG